MFSLGVLLRGLLAVGGIVTIFLSLPAVRGSYEAQRTDGLQDSLSRGQPVSPQALQAGLAAIDRAVATEASPLRYFQRSSLLSGAALGTSVKATDEQRTQWLQQARADLERGLARDPARPVEWLRLASVRQALDGASRDVVAPLFMSIDTGAMNNSLWKARLRIILTNWGSFTDAEKARLNDYVVMTWRYADERREFGQVVFDPFDEVILRYLLRDEPKAQEELTRWIREFLRR